MSRSLPQAIMNANARLRWLDQRFARERTYRRRMRNIVERVRLSEYIPRAMRRGGYWA